MISEGLCDTVDWSNDFKLQLNYSNVKHFVLIGVKLYKLLTPKLLNGSHNLLKVKFDNHFLRSFNYPLTFTSNG